MIQGASAACTAELEKPGLLRSHRHGGAALEDGSPPGDGEFDDMRRSADVHVNRYLSQLC